MQPWGPISLTATAVGSPPTGIITQLYPSWASPYPGAGSAGSAAPGAALPVPAQTLYRRPQGGQFGQVAVETDATDGGVIQLFDVNGLDILADVSSGTTITNAQMNALIAQNMAKLIWEQNFAAAPGAPIVWNWSQGFLRGLAARYIGAPAATCKLNIIGAGGFQYLTSAGVYSGG
jgi:hypothetical protein